MADGMVYLAGGCEGIEYPAWIPSTWDEHVVEDIGIYRGRELQQTTAVRIEAVVDHGLVDGHTNLSV